MPFDANDPDTKAAIKAAIEEANTAIAAKNSELLDDLKKVKADLRSKSEINPADLEKLESENDKLKADLSAAQKAAKEATTIAEKATKAIESEQGAARQYAIEAELSKSVSSLKVVPELAAGFLALHRSNVKADIVDGKYVVTSADGKSLDDYFKESMTPEIAKHWTAAPVNSGGGGQGNNGGGASGKTVDSTAFNAMPSKDRATFMADGGAVVDKAA